MAGTGAMKFTTGAAAAHAANDGETQRFAKESWGCVGHSWDKLDVLDNRCAGRLDHDAWHAHVALTAT